MPTYRKRPIEIEAMQFTGSFQNYDEICEWAKEQFAANTPHSEKENCVTEVCSLYIKTLEGTHKASVGDYIIRGIQGEYYPCKPDIFTATYELVK